MAILMYGAVDFPEKITTDYLNTEKSRAARIVGGNSDVRYGERLVAIKGPEDKYCVRPDMKSSASLLLTLFNATPSRLIQTLSARFNDKPVFDCSINDAVAKLQAFEEIYAAYGRPFPRAQDARHWTQVPTYVPVGFGRSLATPRNNHPTL